MYDFKKWHPMFAWKHTRPYFEGYTKKRSSWSLWEIIYRQSCTKTFRANLGKFGQNFVPHKFACFHTYDEKSPPPLLPLVWKGRGGKVTAMPPFSCASVHIILHALSTRCCSMQCVSAMNINYQRSHKTEQFMTAKISGNALKQRSRIHLVLCQRSSQLKNYNAARMFRRIAVDQKVCGWDGRHPGLTVWNLLNYTRIENAWITQENFCFLLCGCYMYNY